MNKLEICEDCGKEVDIREHWDKCPEKWLTVKKYGDDTLYRIKRKEIEEFKKKGGIVYDGKVE